jgi:DNA-binding NarL/FixJ family response regulator
MGSARQQTTEAHTRVEAIAAIRRFRFNVFLLVTSANWTTVSYPEGNLQPFCNRSTTGPTHAEYNHQQGAVMNPGSPSFDEWQLAELLAALDLPTSVLANYSRPVQEQIVQRAQEFASQVNLLLEQAEHPDSSSATSISSSSSPASEDIDPCPHKVTPETEAHARALTGEPPHSSLSVAEHRVAELIGRGRSNKTIALELGISRRTVETHATRVFRKLNVESRLQLALALR